MNSIFSYIYSFITDGILYIIILLPVYVLCRLIFLKKSQKNISSKISIKKEIICTGFFIYLIMLFTQTFIVNEGNNFIEIIPFRIIIQQFQDIKKQSDGFDAFTFNVVGNIGVFVPVGMIIAYLTDKSLKKTLLYGCILSVFIEVVQIPLNRTTDIDDVILNTAGTFIGFHIYNFISKKRTAVK